MATPLADQRIERVLDVTGSRVGTEERAARMTDGRSIPSEYDVHYNDKYGTTLTDAQVLAADKSQSEFTAGINKAKSDWEGVNSQVLSESQKWEQSKANVDSIYNSQLGNINSAYNKGLADIESQKTGLPISYDGYVKTLGSTDYSTWKDTSTSDSGYTLGTPTKMDDFYQEALSVAQQRVDNGDMGSYTYVDQNILNQRMDELVKDDYINNVLHKNEGFNTFYNDWVSKNAVPVTINNVKGFTKTYYTDRETAAKIAATDLKGYGAAGSTPDGGAFVSSDTYANSFIEPLNNYERNTKIALGNAYTSQVPGVLDSNRSALESEYKNTQSRLSTEYSTAQSQLSAYGLELQSARDTLSSRQQEIAAKEAENANVLNTVRSKYAEKLKNISNTIGTLFHA